MITMKIKKAQKRTNLNLKISVINKEFQVKALKETKKINDRYRYIFQLQK
jgi:hypothetical protein